MNVRWKAVAEAALSVAAATGLAALLDRVAPATGLGPIYLLCVLYVTIRRGQIAGLATAVLSVLALNFFFIEPRYQFAVAHAANGVELGVLLIAALVVGRLAASGRERELVARAREGEARMLAAAAAAVLEEVGIEAQLHRIEQSVRASIGSPGVRLALEHAPRPGQGESATRLPTTATSAWLYVPAELGWSKEDARRVAEGLARILDVALVRERLSAEAAEAEASRQADVAKTALLHAISHDLRSPLTAIAAASSGLRTDDLGEPDRAALVAAIEDETERLSRLIDDLLDLSRIEAHAVNPSPDWSDLREAIGRGAEYARRVHGERPIELDLPDELPLVHADPVQLERVFANLISNAVKFSPPGAPVRVTASSTAGRVVARVVNKGPGIPPRERPRVFEPFFRGSGADRGSGLGLAIARGFVEANGGQIVLQSGTRDETAFLVSFPLVAPAVPA